MAARHARAHHRAFDGGGGPSSLGRDHRFIGRGCACARPFFLRWAMGLEKKFYAHRREEACLRRVLSHLTCGFISIGQREDFFEKSSCVHRCSLCILIPAARSTSELPAWGVSSVWLERRPVTSEVAGSSPVLPAIAIKASSSDGAFCGRFKS